MLASSGESLLLFTQNVVKVIVYHIPARQPMSKGCESVLIGPPSTTADMSEAFRIVKRPLRILRSLSPIEDTLDQRIAEAEHELCGQCAILKASSEVMAQLRAGISVEAVVLPSSSLVIAVERRMEHNSELQLDKVRALPTLYTSSA